MLELHCTKKLRELLGVDLSGYEAVEAEASTLGVWYANIFKVEYDPYLYSLKDESYLLMVNQDSLLSFYIHIPEELSLGVFVSELPGWVEACLIENGFTPRQMKLLLPEFQQVTISKAADRSMIGYLRSFAFDYETQILRNAEYDFSELKKTRIGRILSMGPNDMPRNGLLKPTPKRTARFLASSAVRRATYLTEAWSKHWTLSHDLAAPERGPASSVPHA